VYKDIIFQSYFFSRNGKRHPRVTPSNVFARSNPEGKEQTNTFNILYYLKKMSNFFHLKNCLLWINQKYPYIKGYLICNLSFTSKTVKV